MWGGNGQPLFEPIKFNPVQGQVFFRVKNFNPLIMHYLLFYVCVFVLE